MFDCNLLLSFLGSSSTRCFWRDSSHLTIILNSASTLLPGDSITIYSGLIGPNADSVTNRLSSLSSAKQLHRAVSLSSSTRLLTLTSRVETFPEIRVNAQTQLPACAPFTLDLTLSSGFMGRVWQNVSIVVRSGASAGSVAIPEEESAAALVSLNDFYTRVYDIQSATELPAGNLQAGYIYVFDIVLCNYLLKCAVASHHVLVAPTYSPYSTIHKTSDSKKTIMRGDALSIPTAVHSVTCGSEAPRVTSLLSQTWTVFENDVAVGKLNPDPVPLLKFESNETQSLLLPAYSFPSDAVYRVIEVVKIGVVDTVTNELTNVSFENFAFVRVQSSSVKAVLSSTGQVMLGLNETKWIDASGSYDSNVSPGAGDGGGLHYSWECLRMGPLTVDAPGTDCDGFLRVNASLPSQAQLSPTFTGREGSALLGSEFRIKLIVQSADKLDLDSIVLTAHIVSFCCVSIELDPVELYNVKQDFRVSAAVQSSLRGNLVWSIEEIDSTVLSATALTSTGFVFDAPWLSLHSSQVVNLVLPPYSLQAGMSYTVQLTFTPLYESQGVDVLGSNSVYSSIHVVPNSLPLPGVFTVSPGEGLSLVDHFSFHAFLWSSDHLPLLYSFGFQSASSNLMVPLMLKSSDVKLTAALPQGVQQKDYSLTCVLHVYDAVDARSEAAVEVRVSPGGSSAHDLSSVLDSLADGNSSLSFETVFGPLVETVAAVNCSLAPDCSLYHRQNCSAVAHTCGPCVSEVDFFGEDGHHNSRCARRATLQEGGQDTSCSDDSACPAFQNCVSGSCTAVAKECPADCSGHGVCRHVVSNTGEEVTDRLCVVGDTFCSAECVCNASHWFGRDCSRANGDMQEDSVLYMQIICLFADQVVMSEESSVEAVTAWVDELSILSQDSFSFTHESAVCSLTAQRHIMSVISVSPSSFSFSVIQAVLNSVATVLDYRTYFDYQNQTIAQKSQRLELVTGILHTYCDVISDAMVLNQYPLESSRSRLRVMSTLFTQASGQDRNASSTDLLFTETEQETYNNVHTSTITLTSPATGGWCMISLDAVVYSDLAEGLVKSNTLSVVSFNASTTSGSNGSSPSADSFSLTLEDVADMDMLSTLPRTTHNITCSEADSDTSFYQACPHNVTHEFVCNEDSIGVWEVTCPAVTTNVTCRSIRAETAGLTVDDSQCVVTSMSDSSIVCDCPLSSLYPRIINSKVRSSGEDSSEVDVEFSAMIDFVVEDFVSTWSSVDDLSFQLLNRSKRSLLTLSALIFFVIYGLYYTENADKSDKAASEVKHNKKTKMGKEGAEKKSSKDNGQAVVDLDAIFPSILTEESLVFLLLDAVKKSHRWASIYFNYDPNFPRILRFLSISSIVICTLFFNSLLYNLTNPDDGSCQIYENAAECLREPSQYSSWDTKCHWEYDSDDGTEGRCWFKEPSNNAMAVIFVAMVSAILSIPFVLMFEFIIMEVLSRPTASPFSSTHTSVATAKRTKASDITTHENVERANVELKELVSGLYEHFRCITVKERKELEELWGLSFAQVESYLHTLSVPSGLVEDPHSAGMQSPRRHGRNSIRPSTTANGSNTGDGDGNGDGDGGGKSDEVVVGPRGRPSMLRRTLNAWSSHEEKSIFHNLLRDIISMHVNVEKESVNFASMSSEEQGTRLLVLFQKDLLSGVTGEITEKKSMQGKKEERQPVSKWAKRSGFAFILLLDSVLLFYIFLFAVNQDQSRQTAWIQSFAIWLILEIFLVSSLVMVMSEFVVPSLMFAEVKKIKTKMIKTVLDYQSKVLDGDVENTGDTKAFNVAPYLFTSTQLAIKFPCTLESKIIQEFKTTLPKRTYQRSKNSSMNAYRGRLRLTAVTNSINMMFLFVISRLLSVSFTAVERCFYDLLGWVGIGYFVFFQAVLIQDNTLLAFFIYISFIIAVSTFLYYYYRSACILRTKKRAGVISIKTLYEAAAEQTVEVEVEAQVDASPAELVIQKIVQRFGEHRTSKYNPRFSRIMASLKETPAFQESLRRNQVVRLDLNGDVWKTSSGPPSVSEHDPNECVSSYSGHVAINFDLSSSDHESDEGQGDEDQGDENQGDEDTRSGSKSTLQHDQAPRMLSAIVRSHKPAFKRILRKRAAARDLKKRLEIDGVVLSDSSDSYPDDCLSQDGMFDFDSLSGESDLSDSDSDSDRVAAKERIVSDLFTRSKQSSLARRIRDNRDGIKDIGLKRRAKGIEESFVLSTTARRSSILANQARAHTKLQKRIKQRRSVAPAPGVGEGDRDGKGESVVSPQDQSGDKGSESRKGFQRLTSDELFNEKKNMVKNYTAHQSLREHALGTQRKEAKAALEMRVQKKQGDKMV